MLLSFKHALRIIRKWTILELENAENKVGDDICLKQYMYEAKKEIKHNTKNNPLNIEII